MTDSKNAGNDFYFECTNPECDVAYYSKHFLDAILLWGFIFLTNGKEYLIGITCIGCKHTSIRRYENLPGNFPFDLESRDKNSTIELKHYVPFSPEILSKTSKNANIPLEKKPSPKDLFYVPENFTTIVDYTDQIDESLLPIKININDIKILNEYEDLHNLKVFPRIVADNSAYHLSEKWLTDRNMKQLLKKYQKDDKSCFNDVHNSLVLLVKNGFKIKNDPTFESKQIFCENIVKNDLTLEQYERMNFILNPSEHTNKIACFFLYQYSAFRNKKEFEVTCYNEFFNFFAQKFYYDSIIHLKLLRCFAPKIVFFDWLNWLKFFPGLNSNHKIKLLAQNWEDKKLAHQQQNDLQGKIRLPIKQMSGDQLMKRWGLDGFEIINFVLLYNLPAYDMYNFCQLTEEKLKQDGYGKLLSGNIEEQSIALRRLRFDPETISKFEKKNLQLFEKTNIKIQDFSKKDTDTISNFTKENKLRKNQLHKIEVRKIAEKLWKQYPDKTIADMIFEDEINEVFSERENSYAEKTLRDWINDLCPNREPGRRKKSKDQ